MQIVRAAVAVVATVVRAIGGFKVGSIAIGQILLKTGTAMALNALRARLSGQRDYAAAKQAQVTELTLGEGPRELIVGRAVTGGQLMDGFNYSVNNDQEVLVIALADHECDALEGFWLNDNYITFTGDGTVSGYSDSNGAALQVYFRSGTRTQTPPSVITSNSGGRWTSNDRLVGVAYVAVIYRAAPEFFPAGKPRFRWVLRGAKLYDPRKDSTVSGGSGSHRWDTVSTHEWSENAYLAYYNWKRGVRAQGYDSAGNANLQVMVGPARSADEAPPAEAIAKISICDEDVALKAGGTEKRYRVGGVIQSTEQWIRTEEEFAAAMAGELIDAAGAVAIAPGASSSTQFEIVADDFVIGERIDRQDKRGRNDLYNRVETTYQSLTHAGAMISAPTRADASARTADGEDRDLVIALRLVTSHTQAQRCSQIALRAARMQRALTVPLGPKFCLIEPGDWGTVTSARHTAGATRTFVVDRAEHGAAISRLALRETTASVFAWTPATDEIDPGTVAPTASTPIGAATISSFDAVALTLTGADGAQLPAIKVTWTAITDLTVKSVQIEVRKTGTTDTVVMFQDRPSLGELIITEGVISGASMQVRGVCRTEPRRTETATGWVNVTAPTLGSGVLNVSVPTGVQALVNADFNQGASGVLGWDSYLVTDSGLTVTAGRNLVGYFGQPMNVLYALVTGTPAVNAIWYGWKSASDSVADLLRFGLPVAAGDRVYAGALMARYRCTAAEALVFWYGPTGSFVSASVAGSGGTIDGAVNGSVANFAQVGGFVTAPSGAAFAVFAPRGVSNGSGATPYIFWARPMLARVAADQTAPPPYSGSRGDPLADVTSANTAAAIAAQGGLATANYFRQSTNPGAAAEGSIWTDTSGATEVVRQRIGGAWVAIANNAPGLTDAERTRSGSGTGVWSSSGGTWTPAGSFSVANIGTGGSLDYSIGWIGAGATITGAAFNGEWRLLSNSTVVASGVVTANGSSDPIITPDSAIGGPFSNPHSGTVTYALEMRRRSGATEISNLQWSLFVRRTP